MRKTTWAEGQPVVDHGRGRGQALHLADEDGGHLQRGVQVHAQGCLKEERSSPISLGCRSMLLRQPKLEEKMLSICRSSMLSAVGAC